MSAPALSRPSIPLSVCDACDGDHQKRYEPLKFNGVTRDWLCASCRAVLLEPAAVAVCELGVMNTDPAQCGEQENR
ncbi:hypothetical protein [Mycolicibacterium austroafricanum]|uniref:hypothetical protein n=1 Tax=Mycolicibacterium austroafricanum TaxID=39687 RepID=UPI00056023E3|nr:hypothetical protein [Mycolicibacterium austroafricanum]